MEPSFDLTTSLGPIKKAPMFSGASLKPLWNILASGASSSTLAAQDIPLPSNIMSFPMEGLKVSALINFIAVCGGEKKIRNLSTKQVVERYILPVTNSTKTSYCDLVKARDPSVIGPATVYISHSWGARFMDTYRAIKYHYRNETEVYLWFDIFCLDQRVFYPLHLQQRARRAYAAIDPNATLDSQSAPVSPMFDETGASQEHIFGAFRSTFGDTSRAGSANPDMNNRDSVRDNRDSRAPLRSAYSMYGTQEAFSPVPDHHTNHNNTNYNTNNYNNNNNNNTTRSMPSTPLPSHHQWNGHYIGGEAGDWCADILKHGMDRIGSVLLVLNPSPNPEPKTGTQKHPPGHMGTIGENHKHDHTLHTSHAQNNTSNPTNPTNTTTNTNTANLAVNSTDDEAEEIGSMLHWDQSKYRNPVHALSRLWVLYEIYCTTVDRSTTRADPNTINNTINSPYNNTNHTTYNNNTHTNNFNNNMRSVSTNDLPRTSVLSPLRSLPNSRNNSRPNSTHRTRHTSGILFDIALHYSILEDSNHTTSANIKNKKSPFNVDLHSTCADMQNFTKWIHCMDLSMCNATDKSDAERLLSIINVDIGASVFFNTVRDVLNNWIIDTMNDNSSDNVHRDKNHNTYFNASTNKQRLYVQHTLCNLFYIKGDSVRAEGALIELGEQQKGKMGSSHPDHLDCLQYLAEFYLSLDRLSDAEPILIECLERRKHALGPQHPDSVHTLDTLANLYDVTGSPHLAEPLYAECYEIRREILSPTHIQTLKAMHSLSVMMFNQAEYNHAEVIMRECLDLRRSALGATHPDTIESLQKLAVLHEIRHEYTTAELLYHEYLHAAYTVYGPDHVNTLNTLYLLGTNYRNQYKYNLAEQLLRVVMDKYRHTLGIDHDSTMQVIFDLAALYEDVAQYEHSLSIRNTYYALCKSKYGEESILKTHTTTKASINRNINPMAAIVEDSSDDTMKCNQTHQCMHDLAALHIKMGKCNRALPLLQRCLELRQTHLGTLHVDTLSTQCMLAYVHINNGNYSEAEALLVRTIEDGNRVAAEQRKVVVEEVLDELLTSRNPSRASARSRGGVGSRGREGDNGMGGNNNSSNSNNSGVVIDALGNIINTNTNTNNTSTSRGYVSQLNSLNGNNNSRSEDGTTTEEAQVELPVVLDAMTNLGLMYTEQGKLAEAEALFMGTWESYRKLHSDDLHPDVLTVVHNLAGLYLKQRKFDLSEFFYSDCLKKRTAVLGAHHPATLHTLSNFAALFTHMGKYDIAEHMIQECQTQCTSTLGADHPTTLRNINNLAYNSELMGNLRRAETLHKQCLVKRRLALGATHPETLSSSNNLACVYVKQVQQVKEAEKMFKECLKSRQSSIGLHHPDTLSTINNIATLYMRSDRQELAYEVYTDCTEECIEQLGHDHPVTQTALSNLQDLAGLLNKNSSSMVNSPSPRQNVFDFNNIVDVYENEHDRLTIHTTPSPPRRAPRAKKQDKDPRQQLQNHMQQYRDLQQEYQYEEEEQGGEGGRRARRRK